MDSLKFNFVRRAFIVPVLLSAVVIAIIWFAAPKIIESSNAVSVAAVSNVNISKYSLNEYNKFSQLKSGGYVATVNCKIRLFLVPFFILTISKPARLICQRIQPSRGITAQLLLSVTILIRSLNRSIPQKSVMRFMSISTNTAHIHTKSQKLRQTINSRI